MAFAPPFQDNIELFLGVEGGPGSDVWARTWLGDSSIWSIYDPPGPLPDVGAQGFVDRELSDAWYLGTKPGRRNTNAN